MSIQNLFTTNSFPIYAKTLHIGETTISGIDTDVSMTANSDIYIPTQKAVKAYVDNTSGPIGPTGTTGSAGANGADGADGATGPTGPNGANATYSETSFTATFTGPINATTTIYLKKVNKVVYYYFLAIAGTIGSDTVTYMTTTGTADPTPIPLEYRPSIVSIISGIATDASISKVTLHYINTDGSIDIKYDNLPGGGAFPDASSSDTISVQPTSGFWYTTA